MKKSHSQLVKKLIGTCGLLAVVASARAQFTFPVYEPFSEYPQGERISKTAADSPNSVNFWGGPQGVGNSGSTSSSPLVTNIAGMSYPSLVPDPATASDGTNYGVISQTGVGRTCCAVFTAQTNGTLYSSFLLNLQTLPSGVRPIYGLNGANSGTPSPNSGISVWVNSLGQLQIGKNAAALGPPATNITTALAPGGTYFVVIAYKFTGTAPDEIDLWLNPTSLGNNANVPAPTISTTNGANSATLQSLCLYAGTGAPITTNFYDELRVDNNWAGVTPATPWSGTTFNVGGGGFGCAGFSTNVTLSGSEVGVSYILFTNSTPSGTILAGNGSPLTFANLTTTALYNVLATNATSGQVHWMNGSALISVATPAGIVSNPANQTAVLGSTAIFSVSAVGSSISYQWHRNGTNLNDGNEISGSTSPTLVISPVGSGDLATTTTGYDVTVSDQCGNAATSAPRASLTSVPAASLAWIGAPTNTWDLDITTNWTANAGASQVAFINGDSVAFDNTQVAIANSVVSLASGDTFFPSSITVNGSFNLIGSGSISGPAALHMTGGTLNLAENNSFTGGSTITSSQVTISNSAFGGLGLGPVTLNSSTMEVMNTGSTVAGVSNNINVTSDSTIQYDGTGTEAAVFFGAITGNPGTTLSINTLQTPATPSRFRFYSTNMTENGNLNIETIYTQIAPYNATGTQTYNGVISGSGELITRNDGATNIYNGANTYSEGTLLTAGGTGLGIDSVSSSPPNIDSGPLGTGSISLQADGTGGTANATLLAAGGSHTLGNPFTYAGTGTIFTLNLSGTNNLTLTGEFSLAGQDGTGATNRVINVDNKGLTTMAGVIDDNSNGSSLDCGITKIGVGTLILSATNTYTGPTIVTNGTLLVNGELNTGAVTIETNSTLGGSGTILGPVTIQLGATLAPGDSGTGALAIDNSLTLMSGSTTSLEVNKGAGTEGKVTGLTSVTYAGTLTATNISGTPVIGDTFPIFSTGGHSGSFSATNGTPGPGLLWSFNPGTGVLSVIGGGSIIATNATNITFVVSGNGTSLTLNWPTDHKGWRLQAQTNAFTVGLTTNWVTVAGSTSVNQEIVPLAPGNGSVFYRLVSP